MTAERKRNMMRLGLANTAVHFEGPQHERGPGFRYIAGTDITLCGIELVEAAHATREPVTCARCLALHRWVHQHRREATDA